MSMDRVRAIMDDARVGFVATCADGRPRVRPMSFVMQDDGRLWSSTYRGSGKLTELEANPLVEVCFLDAKGVHVRIEGRVVLTGGEAEKRSLLEQNPKVRRHFEDEHDPKFVHVEVQPTRIQWTEPGFGEYHQVPLG